MGYDGEITIGCKLETKKFDKQIAYVEHKIKMLEQELDTSNMGDKSIRLSAEEVLNLEKKLEIAKNKLFQLNEQKEKANKPKPFPNLNDGAKDLSNSFEKAIKKASKLVLSIFGIRSAYLAMRRASSELAQYDEEYGANLEYIRYALTQAIAPVLKYIVDLAMKLLAYINAIVHAWFGINLFENASVDNFKAMKQGVSGVTDEVQELKKQLAGFDEMNIIQENGTTSRGGGGGGIALPTMDLANLQDVELPEWVKWIADHGNELKAILLAIGAAILGIKIAQFVSGLSQMSGLFTSSALNAGKLLTGIGLVAGGIAMMIEPISDLTMNWNRLTTEEKLADTALAVVGGALEAFGLMLLGVSGPVAAVFALGTAIGIVIGKLESEKRYLNDAEKAQEDYNKAKEDARKATEDYKTQLDRAKEAEKNLNDIQEKTGISAEDLNDQITKGTIKFGDLSEQQIEVYNAYLKYNDEQELLTKKAKEMSDALQEQTDQHYLNELASVKSKEGLDAWIDSVITGTKATKEDSKDAARIFSRAMAMMGDKARDTFSQHIPEFIREGLDPSVYTNPLQELEMNFGMTLNDIYATARRVFGFIFNPTGNIGGLFSTGISAGAHYLGQAKGAVVYNGMPHLAVGGIINQPRKRNTNRKSNSRRKRSRGCYTINR